MPGALLRQWMLPGPGNPDVVVANIGKSTGPSTSVSAMAAGGSSSLDSRQPGSVKWRCGFNRMHARSATRAVSTSTGV